MTADMYRYRKLTEEQQRQVVQERQRRGFPKHSPPHLAAPNGFRIVTGTCFEHRSILQTTNRLADFEDRLLGLLTETTHECASWCVLPNHYHILVKVASIEILTTRLGKLHGRTAFEWNGEDLERGRTVWYRCQDRVMRSEAHYCTTLNYIHNNPVKHRLTARWQDWPFSSVHWYLKEKGREWLMENWREYPVLNYGLGWDDFIF